MDIQFLQDDLRKVADSGRRPRKWPQKRFDLYIQRLMTLKAANNLLEAKSAPGHLEELRHFPDCHVLSLRLDDGKRLILEPANDPIPEHTDGSLDWAHVTAIQIVRIEDYHG